MLQDTEIKDKQDIEIKDNGIFSILFSPAYSKIHSSYTGVISDT